MLTCKKGLSGRFMVRNKASLRPKSMVRSGPEMGGRLGPGTGGQIGAEKHGQIGAGNGGKYGNAE